MNSAAVIANMSDPESETISEKQDEGATSRRDREGLKYSTLKATPRPSGRGIKMMGQRTVSREVFRV